MKIVGALRIASLLLLPGAMASTYAQEREQEKQPEQKQQQAKPEQKQQQAKPAAQQQKAQPAKPAQQAQRQQPAKPAQQQKAQPAKPAQQAQHQQPAKPAQQQQQASQGSQTSAGHGSIPEARFRASFGSSHTFHVNRSEFANGSGRFQYGGSWFNVLDPWPAGWLYTDSVYVDYLNGGYFLCDPVHPGVYISINIG